MAIQKLCGNLHSFLSNLLFSQPDGKLAHLFLFGFHQRVRHAFRAVGDAGQTPGNLHGQLGVQCIGIHAQVMHSAFRSVSSI